MRWGVIEIITMELEGRKFFAYFLFVEGELIDTIVRPLEDDRKIIQGILKTYVFFDLMR
jgi:hypothetical protein